MAPLIQMDGDEIIEASLLGPANDRPVMSSTIEEEAVLLRDELGPQKAPEVTMFSSECPKTPELEEPTEWSDAPSPPALHLQPQTPKETIPRIPGEPGIGLEFNVC